MPEDGIILGSRQEKLKIRVCAQNLSNWKKIGILWMYAINHFVLVSLLKYKMGDGDCCSTD